MYRKYVPPILILFSLTLSITIRVCNVPDLEWRFPVSADPARVVRQAKLISQSGHLPNRDLMRSFPVGRLIINEPTLLPHSIAWLHKFFSLFIHHLTLEQVSIFYPVIFSALACFVFYLLVARLMDKNISLLAVNILAVSPALVGRTMAGYTDHDALCLFLSSSAYYFYVRSYQSKKNRLLFAFVSGAVMAILGFTWQGFFIFI